MPFKSGVEASQGILKILQFMKNYSEFSEYLTDDLEKHFINWARRCRSGRFEEIPGINLFEHDGYDSNGVSLWLRNTGTKCENFHQKLHVGTGPFGMGVESAHYFHVILSYDYLVNAAVRRGHEPDFGHWKLDIEDRIQCKMLKIWNVTVFTMRVNVSEFRTVEFVAVGIGPLSFNKDYVTKADHPSPKLKGGLKVMAQKMNVDIPPLPFSTPAEYHLLSITC